jgi:hypothetical protein
MLGSLPNTVIIFNIISKVWFIKFYALYNSSELVNTLITASIISVRVYFWFFLL